jgi:hypothetical protein
MPGFDAGTIVRVPVPYTHRPVRQHRPALVSDGPIGPDGGLLWVVMITSAANRRWPGDVALEAGHAECGLPAPPRTRWGRSIPIASRWSGRRSAGISGPAETGRVSVYADSSAFIAAWTRASASSRGRPAGTTSPKRKVITPGPFGPFFGHATPLSHAIGTVGILSVR